MWLLLQEPVGCEAAKPTTTNAARARLRGTHTGVEKRCGEGRVSGGPPQRPPRRENATAAATRAARPPAQQRAEQQRAQARVRGVQRVVRERRAARHAPGTPRSPPSHYQRTTPCEQR